MAPQPGSFWEEFLTDLLSWEWIFFVNVPVGLVGLALSPLLLAESRDAHGQSHDLPGAVLVTSGLVLLVLGMTQGQQWGWTSVRTLGTFGSATVLLAIFALWETRQRDPLVPFSIFRLRTLTAANVAGLIAGTAMFSMFLILTLYMQQVLGYSALTAGVAYLAVAGTAVIWANVAAAAVNRIGVKPTLIFGMSTLTVGLLCFTQVSVGGSYWADLFPGFLILGIALPFAFVPITIAALAGTKPHEAGLASGLINTSQQIGGALGIALLSTIAVSTADKEVAEGVPSLSHSPTVSLTPSGQEPRSPLPASSSRSSWCAVAICKSQRTHPNLRSRRRRGARRQDLIETRQATGPAAWVGAMSMSNADHFGHREAKGSSSTCIGSEEGPTMSSEWRSWRGAGELDEQAPPRCPSGSPRN